MKEMRKKKSAGHDNISQECLLLGKNVLAAPLMRIINTSIQTGVVPEIWKDAVVTPILKKGDAKELKNYRPVSCLSAASKALEKVVCEQLTKFAETHQILPNSQHGFRANRSTMTALTAMQKEWIKNSENGLMTGVLVWDLSSAFDTLDIGLFLEYFMRMASTQCPSLLKMLEHLVNTSFRGRLLQSGVPAYCGRHIVSQHFITLLLLHLK